MPVRHHVPLPSRLQPSGPFSGDDRQADRHWLRWISTAARRAAFDVTTSRQALPRRLGETSVSVSPRQLSFYKSAQPLGGKPGNMDDVELQVPVAGFEDVTPIPQEDGPNPVVSIAYKHNCEWIEEFGFFKCSHMVGVPCGAADFANRVLSMYEPSF